MLERGDRRCSVELIKKTLKIYPYQPGGFGTSIATEPEIELVLPPDQPLDPRSVPMLASALPH